MTLSPKLNDVMLTMECPECHAWWRSEVAAIAVLIVDTSRIPANLGCFGGGAVGILLR
jgi:hypothetical protein